MRPRAPGRRLLSGRRTSSSTSSPVSLARRLHLPWIGLAAKPGVPFSTRKPSTRSGPRAQTRATSARLALVIHSLPPLQDPVVAVARRGGRHGARVRAVSGSVRPKQPTLRPAASSGSQRSFWLVAAVGRDGPHHQAALHRGEAAQAAVAALELLADDAVDRGAEPGAARSVDRRPQQAQGAHLGDQLDGEGAGAQVVAQQRQETLLDEAAGTARTPRSSSSRSPSKR